MYKRQCKLIEDSINDDPPIGLKDGGIIKDGFNEDIDKYRHAKTEGKQWLSELELREREKTGIKNLRVKFNKVFGYYLEVTNSYKDLVPVSYTHLALNDPVGEIVESTIRPNGLEVCKKRVPLGVIGIIYESRPNVTADAFGLCFKAGNAVIRCV